MQLKTAGCPWSRSYVLCLMCLRNTAMCVAGAGVEYMTCGLNTAILTHFLYDWIALIYVLQQWGGGGGDDDGSSSRPTAAPPRSD